MSLDEESLEIAANGGLMDFDKWPSMVEPLLGRLEYIIYNTFPMPEVPHEASSTLQFQPQYLNPAPSFLHEPNSISSSNNKENAVPPDLQTPPRPPPSSIVPSSSTERVPDSLPASQAVPPNSALPAPLLLIHQSFQSTMRSLFSSKPPHTIQRLAELILRPNAHYRTLPAYLRALDRVVSVTSSADIFPLPMQSGASQPNGAINGAENTFILPDIALGSDESLGGALLTPIPWLNNTASPGPEGAAIDDVSITTTVPQLEQQLLTQPPDPTQQQSILTHSETSVLEGDMIPVSTPTASITDPSEEIPHARGPSILGVEDMGLQGGKGVELTLLSTEGETDSHPAPLTMEQAPEQRPTQVSESGESNTAPGQDDTDGDGDITLSDEPSIPQETEK